MNVDQRQRIEQEIARAAATGLIEAGYSISVFDSEEIVLKRSTNVERIVGYTDLMVDGAPLPHQPDTI
ncbi:TPA: hypothetical protein MYR80_005276, partial [Citrobacter freundii]|nr:hypothetical protein [Citrobacter freundii]